ncbi:unnamed protein product [Didymodactylos carnosus]|uniref:Uncharacterized protein n=1 Tax=Didymodactylos carnosus TaxID=1234261 RepID=A0A813S7H3_9BILA|nr:unnamed protein product [Didymodactylos carnosus]CAF0793215.1 unnamed protein product [Didymodactylos carnosus]CAF3501523.1 unnamed protein product [Didymodactylos carnosus]CAF3577601.1 unnamed protein product [Didymodactylos carnosus]
MTNSNQSGSNVVSNISSILKFSEDENMKTDSGDTNEKYSDELTDEKVSKKESSKSRRQSPVKSAKYSIPLPPRRWIGRTHGYVPPRWINPNSNPPIWSDVLPKITTRWEYNANVLPTHKPPLYPPPKRRRSRRKPIDPQQKEEQKYQHFVTHLKKDIDVYLKKSLREIRFDPTGHGSGQMNAHLINANVSMKSALHERPTDSMVNFEDSLS